MRFPELAWPERVVGPPPAAHEIRVACVGVLFCALLVLAGALVLRPTKAAVLGLGYGEDFIGFYGVGHLLNEYPPERLYDFQTQEEVYLELRPDETHLTLPYVHAPFEALLFRPFAMLPFRVAYFLWLLLGLAAYVVGMVVVTNRFGPWGGERRTVLLLALSFSPFVLETWLGGNVAVLAFLAMATAVALDDANRPVLSGMSLSLCLNKPSLLVLTIPMLLLSRRFKVLVGFGIGAAVLVGSSTLALGIDAWPNFVEALFWWAQRTRENSGFFRDWKYVDINTFSRVLPGGRSWVGVTLFGGLALSALAALVRAWVTSNRRARGAAGLDWAAAITWTLVLNAYVPIYDCVLLVVAGVLTGAALRHPVSGSLPPAFHAVVALCYLSAWLTQPFARIVGIQIYTLVLAYTGMWLLLQTERSQAPQASPGW